jgi:hypothetical protein
MRSLLSHADYLESDLTRALSLHADYLRTDVDALGAARRAGDDSAVGETGIAAVSAGYPSSTAQRSPLQQVKDLGDRGECFERPGPTWREPVSLASAERGLVVVVTHDG